MKLNHIAIHQIGVLESGNADWKLPPTLNIDNRFCRNVNNSVLGKFQNI